MVTFKKERLFVGGCNCSNLMYEGLLKSKRQKLQEYMYLYPGSQINQPMTSVVT